MSRLIPSARPFLFAGAALAALVSLPAQAQDDASPNSEATAAEADQGEGEILVTARRREETLIDVPISMSVVSGDTLVRAGAVDITALQDIELVFKDGAGYDPGKLRDAAKGKVGWH